MLTRVAMISISALILGLVIFSSAFCAVKLDAGNNPHAYPGLEVSPIKFGPNSQTQEQLDRKAMEFHRRTIMHAYQDLGNHDPAWDEQVKTFLEGCTMSAANLPDAPEAESLASLGEQIVGKGCTDLLFLSCYGILLGVLDRKEEAVKLLEQCVPELEKSKYLKVRAHQAALRLYILRTDIEHMSDAAALPYQDRIVRLTIEALKDGSFRDGESPMALRMLNVGWDEWYLRDKASEVETKIRELDGVDPYFRDVFSGVLEVERAWKARGTGWAYKVTEEGWKGFFEHLDKARGYLTTAWKLRPEFPEAPARMIGVAMGQGDRYEETPRLWFDRTVAAQMDYLPAYHNLVWSMRPRWGGTHEEMYAFGLECLKTGRFDTDIPWRFFVILRDLESDMEGDKTYWKKPETLKYLNTMFDGYEKANTDKDLYYRYRTNRAATYWHLGNHAAARQTLGELGEKVTTVAFSALFGVEPEETIAEIYALGGLHARDIQQAKALSEAGNYSEALAAYHKIEAKLRPTDKALAYLKHNSSLAEMMGKFHKGDWVDLVLDKNLQHWTTLAGTWTAEPDGSILAASTKNGLMIMHNADFGLRVEIRGEIEFVKNVYEYFTAGVYLRGYTGPAPLSEDFLGVLLVKSEDKITIQKSHEQDPVHTPGVRILPRNKFLVKVWDEDVQVFVNDAPAAKGHVEREESAPGTVHRVGIGGHYNFEGSALRFSNIQVRCLTTKPE